MSKWANKVYVLMALGMMISVMTKAGDDYKQWHIHSLKNKHYNLTDSEKGIEVTLDAPAGFNFFHARIKENTLPGTSYQLSLQLKTELESGYIALEVQDSKGYQYFSKNGPRLTGIQDWQDYTMKFKTKQDTNAIFIMLRHYGNDKKLKGNVWIRNIILSNETKRTQAIGPPVPPVTIKVKNGIKSNVNRLVLGHNTLSYQDTWIPVKKHRLKTSMHGSGIWNPTTETPVPEMVELLKNIGTTMLRWPGGCAAHCYNWKATVGPLKNRSDQAFGLPEFLRYCEQLDAIPIITLGAYSGIKYHGTPDDFADLVEYLNAPVGVNPTGGKDWAKVREQDGHPEPYNVTWFEYGNESYHGIHNVGTLPHDPISPEVYSKNFCDTFKVMKQVDPTIKIGAVLENGSLIEDKPTDWTSVVVNKTGKHADFFIHHAYLPCYRGNNGVPHAEQLFKIGFAAARQFEVYYNALNKFIKESTGRNIPLAITEFNGSYVQSKPVPYRYCLGTAIQVADLVRVLLNPDYHISNAQYWQFCNEYWGMIKGLKKPYLKRPTYYAYELLNRYLGESLLNAEVNSEGYDCPGGYSVVPASGKAKEYALLDEPKPVQTNWQFVPTENADSYAEKDGSLCVNIKTDKPFNYYHAKTVIPAKPASGYIITAELKTEGLQKPGASLGVGDARGWDITKSQNGSNKVAATEWTNVECRYITLPETKAIEILARRHNKSDAGRFWIRNIQVSQYQPPNAGQVPYVAMIPTLTKNGKFSALLINRHLFRDVNVIIQDVSGETVSAEVLTGPSVDATNESKYDTCKIKPLDAKIKEGKIDITLPPHSLTGIKVD